MSDKLQSHINYIADPRARQAITGLFAKMLLEDPQGNLKLSLGASAYPHTMAASLPRVNVYSTCAVTTGSLRQAIFNSVFTAASTLNEIENLVSIVTSAVRTGNWCNAIMGKIDYSTAGFATGIAGVICAELDLAGVTLGAGSYCCFEAELNCPTSLAGLGVSVPVAFLTGNAWGAGVAEFRDDGYIFNFTGLGSAAGGKVFDTCTASAASHILRILIDGVAYYVMLQSNPDA